VLVGNCIAGIAEADDIRLPGQFWSASFLFFQVTDARGLIVSFGTVKHRPIGGGEQRGRNDDDYERVHNWSKHKFSPLGFGLLDCTLYCTPFLEGIQEKH